MAYKMNFVVVIFLGGGSDLVSVFCDSVLTCVCFSVLDVINEEASKQRIRRGDVCIQNNQENSPVHSEAMNT